MVMTGEAEASPSTYKGGGGGAGGKLRSGRRAHFLRPSMPYDRPPTAFRNPNNSGSWIFKLVNPASRIMTNSATRLFSSFFHKRLVAPPSTSETNLEAGHESPEENPSVVEEQRRKDGENLNNNHDSNDINELEQLLKQKTFTRVEFDHLTELLRSRTVDFPVEVEGRRADPSTSQPVVTSKKQEKLTMRGLENGEDRILLGNVSARKAGFSVGKQILGEDALPTELAKAYMGSRPSKVSPSSLVTQGRTFKQDPSSLNIVPYAPKSPIVSATSRSVRHNSGVHGLIDPWSTTPRPHSRSALYNMSHVPYSGIGSAATVKSINSNNDGYVIPSTSSDWTQGNNSSGVPQVLKRSNSALTDDYGSDGPMRRIRRKYNMVSPSKDELPISSIQRPILSDVQKYDTRNKLATENGHKHISNATFPSVPAQSTEMARKILQQLDKLVPSPTEKSSAQKLAVSREKSPAKLTLSMLSGRALKSMEDIESIKLQNKDNPNAMLYGLNGSNCADAYRYTSQKLDGVIDNGPTKTAAVAVKLAPEIEAKKTADPLVKNTKSDLKPEDSFVSGFDASSRIKRAFQMCAPEDYVDLDDDSCSGNDASIPQPAEEKPKHAVVDQKAVVTETVTIGKPLISTTESKPVASGHMQHRVEAISRASNGPVVNAKDAPTTISPIPTTITNAVSTSLSSPCPLPSVQLPSNFNGLVPLKGETVMHTFSVGSKVADKAPSFLTSSSTTCSFSSSLGQEEDTKSVSNLKKISSSGAVISAGGAGLDEGDTSQLEGDQCTSLQNPASSGMFTSATSTFLSFGASTNSSLSNGSPNSTISISAVQSSPIFCNASSSVTSSSSTSATSSSVFTPSFSAVPLPFPVGSPFKLGSHTTAAASSGIASPTSTTSEAGPKAKEAHSLNMAVSSLKPSPAFPTSGNGIFSFNASTVAGTTDQSSASSQSQGSAVGTSNTGSVFSSSHATAAASSITPFTESGSSHAAASSITPFTESGSSHAAASSITPFTESASSLFGSSSSSPSFGLGGSAFNLTSSSLGNAAPSASAFGLASSTSASLGAGSLGSSSGSFTPVMASSFLGSSSQSASISGSEFVSVSSSPAAPVFSFGASSTATSSGSVPVYSFGTSAAGTSTGSTPQFSFGALTPSTSSGSKPAGFSFQASTPAMSSGSSTPLPFGSSFGASSGSTFSFTSAAPGAVVSMTSFTPSQHAFGVQNTVASFGFVSAGNDQMNEDSMAEDTIQASSAPMASPAFGQPVVANSAPPSNFSFGSPAVAPSAGVFQFGSQQNQSPQTPSPFPATGTLLGTGGSFSLGAGGSDKANRRIVRIRRDNKSRKK